MQQRELVADDEDTVASEEMNKLTGAYSRVIEAVCRCQIPPEKKRRRLKAVLGSLEREVADAVIAECRTSAPSHRR